MSVAQEQHMHTAMRLGLQKMRRASNAMCAMKQFKGVKKAKEKMSLPVASAKILDC